MYLTPPKIHGLSNSFVSSSVFLSQYLVSADSSLLCLAILSELAELVARFQESEHALQCLH